MYIQQLSIEEMARYGATHRVKIVFTDLNGTTLFSNPTSGPADVNYGSLSAAAAASTTGQLIPFPGQVAGEQYQFVCGYVPTQFTASTITALGMTVGYTATGFTTKTAGFLASTELLATTYLPFFPPEIADISGTVGTTFTTNEQTIVNLIYAAVNTLIKDHRKVWNAASTITANFTATGDNLTALTAGEVHLYFRKLLLTNA